MKQQEVGSMHGPPTKTAKANPTLDWRTVRPVRTQLQYCLCGEGGPRTA